MAEGNSRLGYTATTQKAVHSPSEDIGMIVTKTCPRAAKSEYLKVHISWNISKLEEYFSGTAEPWFQVEGAGLPRFLYQIYPQQ